MHEVVEFGQQVECKMDDTERIKEELRAKRKERALIKQKIAELEEVELALLSEDEEEIDELEKMEEDASSISEGEYDSSNSEEENDSSVGGDEVEIVDTKEEARMRCAEDLEECDEKCCKLEDEIRCLKMALRPRETAEAHFSLLRRVDAMLVFMNGNNASVEEIRTHAREMFPEELRKIQLMFRSSK